MKRDEGGEIRLPQEESENGSFDEVAAMLADETMTRGRALKLAGAALLAGSGMMALFQSPAEARKKRRRRRRRKKVTTNPEQPRFEAPEGGTDTKTVTITNHQDGTSVYLLPDAGSNDFSVSLPGASSPLTGPLEIAPGASVPVEVTFTPDASVQSGSLTIVDADVNGEPLLGGEPLKVVPLVGEVT